MKKVLVTVALVLSVAILFSALSFPAAFAVKEEQKLLYARLPSFESLSSVQLALVYRENFIRTRIAKDVAPEGREKSLELTFGSPDGVKEYDDYTIASVTSADRSVTYFDFNAHELPRGGDIFGDVSLADADGLSFWIKDYPSGGRVVMQLMTAPCKGPVSSNPAYAEYDEGFLFESAEVTAADGRVTFRFDDFSPVWSWCAGSIRDYIDRINAVKLKFIPGAGNAPYNGKFYIADLCAVKTASDYSVSFDDEAVCGELAFTASALSENADITVGLADKTFVPSKGKYRNEYGEYCFDFDIDTSAVPDGKTAIVLYDSGAEVLRREVTVDNEEPFLNREGGELNYCVTADGEGGELTVPQPLSDNDCAYKLFTAQVLDAEGRYGLSDIISMKNRDVEGETALGEAEDGYVSTKSDSNAIPFQTYEVDAGGITGDILLNYKGSTVSGESLIMQAFNEKSGEWVTLARGDESGKDNTFSVKVSPADYRDANGMIKVRICEYLYGNGSDTLAWTSDTQYYISHPEWLHYMTNQFDFLVNEYAEGNIAYVCNTGDITDNMAWAASGDESQAILARSIHDKLDLAGVPNGVTPGNHDIGNAYDSWIRYGWWEDYFGAKYYDYQPWWGGGYLGNTSHYDLLTIGGRDFVFVYLGLNHETTYGGILWANSVLKKYPHRTAVLLTHQYLSAESGILTDETENKGYAHLIRSQIIEGNPNVKLVLCGHEPGAKNYYYTPNNGSKVVEILHDYQFGANGGGGYFRYVTFSDGKITNRTYSADYPESTSCFNKPSYNENFVMDMEYAPANRQINTAYFQAVTVGDELRTVSADGVIGARFEGAADGSRSWLLLTETPSGAATYSKAYPLAVKEPHTVLNGDMDGDGEITVTDALMALRIAAKLAEETSEAIAIGDMDGDSTITVTDALVILRIAAKLA